SARPVPRRSFGSAGRRLRKNCGAAAPAPDQDLRRLFFAKRARRTKLDLSRVPKDRLMRTSSKIFLASAAILLAGTAAFAATLPRLHHMTVRLPDGSMEQIAYSGDQAPQVRFLA